MKKLINFIAVACLGLGCVGSSKAQLVTYETISRWSGSLITLSAHTTYAQVFTNVRQVESMTYLFASYNNTGTLGRDFTASFVEWNPTTNTVANVLHSFGTISLAAPNTWNSADSITIVGDEGPETYFTNKLTLNIHQITSPTKTYALLMTSQSTTSKVGFTLTNNNAFAFGYALGYSAFDWGFSQLVVEPGPVPEASTIAAVLACALVAGLVGFRIRQQRRLAPVPAGSKTA